METITIKANNMNFEKMPDNKKEEQTKKQEIIQEKVPNEIAEKDQELKTNELSDMKANDENESTRKITEIREKIDKSGEKMSTEKEISNILKKLQEEVKKADAARSAVSSHDYYQMEKEKTYNFAVQDMRRVEILNNPEVQLYAREYSGLDKETINQKEQELREKISDITLGETGKRTKERQQELDIINNQIKGLSIARGGGLEQAFADFKKEIEKPKGERVL